MSEQEIKEFLQKKEVLNYLKKNVTVNTYVEPTEAAYGYDIIVSVHLLGHKIASDTDYI